MRSKNALIITLGIAFMCCLVTVHGAYATNGLRELGFSSRDSAMAGATTASAGDTSCLVKNPANLARIGNRVDVMYQNILTHDVTLNTRGNISNPYGYPYSYSNVGVDQESSVYYIPGVDAGVSYTLPGTEEHPIAVGVGSFTIAGTALKYNNPRLNPFWIGNGIFDREIDIRQVRIAPGLAVGITDKLFFGMTGNLEIQALRTDLSTNQFQETAGSGNWDFAPGGGFTVGLQYQLFDWLGIGSSYESHTWMGYHHKYKDVLHLVDGPPVINMGLSLKPIKNLELTYDTRYINWTDVKIARMNPVSGGFGWRDQWVFAVGGEYTCFDRLKLRTGYNYGRSQIRRSVVFANALMPMIMEHHFTTGFSFDITKKWSADFTWEHHFINTMSDDGFGDTYSVNGNGTKVSASADILSVGASYKF